MIKLTKRTNTWFLKLSLSYIIILLLPLIVISTLIFTVVQNSLTEEMLNKNQSIAERLNESIEVNLIKFERLADQISKNPDLDKNIIGRSYLNQRNAIYELAKYKETNSLIYELVYYLYGENDIYCSYYNYKVDNFINKVYRYDNLNYDQFYNLINNIDTPFFMPRCVITIGQLDVDRSMITYLTPVKHNEVYGCVMLLIEEKALTELIKNTIKEDGYKVVIMDNKNNSLVTSYGFEEEQIDYNALSSYTDLKNKEAFNYNKRKYNVSYVKSDNSGFSFYVLADEAQVLSKFNMVKRITVIVIFFIILLGGISIFYMIKLNYMPVKNIRRNLEILFPQKNERDDYTAISKAMSVMVLNNDELKNKISDYRYLLKSQILLSLLDGEFYKNHDEYMMVLDDMKIRLCLNRFFVASCELEQNEQDIDVLIDDMEQISSDCAKIYGIKMFGKTKAAFIVNFDDNTVSYEKCIDNMQEVMMGLKVQYSIPLYIGIGQSYDSIDHISKSYMEADAALNYILLKRSSNILHFSEINESIEEFKLEFNNFSSEFISSLQKGDEAGVIDALTKIGKTLKEDNIPIYMVKCYGYDLINASLKISSELSIDLGDEQISNIKFIEFDSIDNLVSAIISISVEICQYISINKQVENHKMDEIVNYVNENFKDSNLSVKELVNIFNLSRSYISKGFKHSTGHSFQEVITNLRMDYIKDMLKSSDMTIKEIVIDSGYVDISNFNRKFKEFYNMSPSEYRRIYSK